MDAKDIKILFMGTSEFAKEILAVLIENKYLISAVFTQPDKKAGREQLEKPSPVKELSTLSKIQVFQPQKLSPEETAKIKEIDPDLIVVIAYGKLIPKEILEIPRFKSINIHPSLLPKFRGPSPIQNAILIGEKETAATIMLIDEKMDHGDILTQKKIEIAPEDTTGSLSKKLEKVSSDLLIETIPLWINGKINPQKQDDSKASYCQLIEREDGHIFWDEEAEIIYNKYRAFQPWPGIFSVWNNNEGFVRIKLAKIKLQKEDLENNFQIGKVFRSEERIGIKASKGAIILEEIQLEGKKPAAIKDFLNGYPNFIGSILK